MLIRRTGLGLPQHELKRTGLRRGEGKLGIAIHKKPIIKGFRFLYRRSNHFTLKLVSMIAAHQKISISQTNSVFVPQGHEARIGQQHMRDPHLTAPDKLERIAVRKITQAREYFMLRRHPEWFVLLSPLLKRQARRLGNNPYREFQDAPTNQGPDVSCAQMPPLRQLCQFICIPPYPHTDSPEMFTFRFYGIDSDLAILFFPQNINSGSGYVCPYA